MSLVADYSSSSDSDEEEEESSGNEMTYRQSEEKLNNKPAVLPSANILLSSKAGEVFTNKYKEAEHAAILALEKHVKMVDTEEKTKIKNGKKICWNYRKGRCRFGSNCQFAHDSDLQVVNGNLAEPNKTKQTNNIPIASTISKPQNGLQIGKAMQQQHSVSAVSATSIPYHNHHHHHHNQQQQQQQKDGKRNRAGLGDSLIPSKRAMKQYNANKKPLN